MKPMQITAESREEATREALERLGVPEDALDIEWSQEEEELLAGARPYVQMNVSIRPDYIIGKIEACLGELLEKMEIEATVQAVADDLMICAQIETERKEILIGYHGETLDALQHLVVRMARLGGRDMPLIIVDVGEYRQERVGRLKRVAEDLAELALENEQEEPFDPMDAIDRKVLHTILKNIDGVESFSRGEGRSRQVVVAPEA
jgi:spoIIIJ-associated protein